MTIADVCRTFNSQGEEILRAILAYLYKDADTVEVRFLKSNLHISLNGNMNRSADCSCTIGKTGKLSIKRLTDTVDTLVSKIDSVYYVHGEYFAETSIGAIRIDMQVCNKSSGTFITNLVFYPSNSAQGTRLAPTMPLFTQGYDTLANVCEKLRNSI